MGKKGEGRKRGISYSFKFVFGIKNKFLKEAIKKQNLDKNASLSPLFHPSFY